MQIDRDPRTIVIDDLAAGLERFNHNLVLPFVIPPQSEMQYPDGKIPVVNSLDHFAAHVNENRLDNLVRETTRAGRFLRRDIPEGSKVVLGAFGWCENLCKRGVPQPFGCNMSRSVNRDALYYVDGDYGLSLGINSPDLDDPIWCAVSSFVFAGRMNIVDESSAVPSILPELAPVIVQFQGAHFSELGNPEQNRRSKGLLGRTPWEYILGSLTESWWRNISKDPMYMLPPNIIPAIVNAQHPQKTIAKLEMIAEDLGYYQDNATGLFRKV